MCICQVLRAKLVYIINVASELQVNLTHNVLVWEHGGLPDARRRVHGAEQHKIFLKVH
jgi:hypothetical protein